MTGPLPNFLVIGAMKSGTTSLATWLRAHPDVFIPDAKELYFFQSERHFARGIDWYRAQFAGADGHRAVGEASPNYIYVAGTPERIASVLGSDVRLVAILRDPVDRAYSHYLHWVHREIFERRSFARAVEDELGAWTGGLPDEDREREPPYFAYLAYGHYVPQLERYVERFGREQLLVLLLDDLERDPAGVYAQVCQFLGVDETFRPPTLGTPENVYHTFRPSWLFRLMVRRGVFDRMPVRLGKWLALDVMTPKVKPRPPLDPALRARLEEHFAEPNAELERWLGRKLPGWSGS